MLIIKPWVLENIYTHLKNVYPNEGCGFLLGSDKGTRVIEGSLKVKNSNLGDQRKRFEISSSDYMKAEKFALVSGFALLGVYHSHPDYPAIPSEHDRKQALPYFSYVIVSVKNGKPIRLTSWKLNDENLFKAEEVIYTKKEILLNV